MPKDPDNLNNGTETENGTPNLPNEDGAVKGCLKSVKEEVSFLDFEERVLYEQFDAILKNPEAMKHLNISTGSSLTGSLGTCERMALDTYSAQPYIKPAGYQNDEDIKCFYELLPIRPGLFPDALFEHLFDIKFKKPRNTVQGAMERMPYYPLLRRLLSTLQPISFKSEGNAHKVQSNRIFAITDPEFHGILISRVPEKQKINNYHPDIYSAIRSQEHMVQQYTDCNLGEVKTLEQMRYKVQNIIATLQNWKGMPQEKREEVKSLIAELEELLKPDVNEHKKKAHERLETAKTLKDEQIDRINPSSTSARLVGSFNDLQKRAAAIFSIMNHTGSDLDLLQRMRESMEITFDKARVSSDFVFGKVYFKPFEENFTSAESIKSGAKKANVDLYDESGNVPRGMTFGLKALEDNKGTPTPFREWAEAVLSNLRIVYKLNKYIALGRVENSEIKTVHSEVIKYANVAQEALKCQKVHRVFAETLDGILNNPEGIRAPWMLEKFEQLCDETPNYKIKSVIEELIALLNEWQGDVLAVISGKKDGETIPPGEVEDKINESNKIYRDKVYELIKSFDFMPIISSLTANA
ncbi:hypothetical protein C0416_04930 [bacterium]|nr:hypothetical protein [bacterium]